MHSQDVQESVYPDAGKFRCEKERVHSECKRHPFENRKKGGFEIMKNFKKVISAVIALAMVISSFTAVSASKFADVADTANYAEAVEVLAALGIVNGTEENGTLVFKPENQVTRAEAATMIVGALNMTDDAQASAGTSQFADVNTQASWASGYVNVGVAQGFIKGYDASTFGPLDNVTYAQMCVMLTSIAGYGEYAAANGGWPTGYTNMAAATGMNKGVAVAADTALTKGQVAQMVYNTLVTPKLGVAEYALTGNTYSQLDGKNGRDYQTLLSEKFDGYVATVTIDGTPVSNTELENNEVEFTVTKCDWWPESEEPCTSNNTYSSESLFAADVDVNGNNLQTGKAVFITNEDDELVMVYLAANGKTETKEVAANTYVPQSRLSSANKYDDDNQKIRFGSTYYKLAEEVTIYVNGTSYITVGADDEAEARTAFDKLIYNAQGTVKLVKEGNSNYYTTIFVDYYQVAKVTSVDVESDETVVTLTGTKALIDDSKDFDEIVISTDAVEEGTTIVTVTRNGEKADLGSLVKGDIIAYAVDFANVTDLEDPKVIDVIATNDTASGTVTKVNDDDNQYTIGGNVYKKLGTVSGLELKNSLVLTLDPFGRIYSTETDGTSTKYAIALRVSTNGDEVTLLLADGTTKTYEPTASVDLDEVADAIDAAGASVEDRIVTYTVKGSTGEISSIEFVDGLTVDAEYKARTGKLGNFTITSTTPVIDATKIETATDARKAGSYAVYGADSFVDGTAYDGVAFKDGTYVSFVVLTNIGTTFGESARFAVVQDAAVEHYTDDDDECELVLALYEGQAEQELLFVPGLYEESELAVGDAFFFETDADGFVDAVYPVYSQDGTFTALEDLVDADALPSGTDGWSWNIWDEGYAIQLAVGAVVEVTDKAITFASVAELADGALDTNVDLDDTQEDGVVTYALASDAVAYVYDVDSDEYKEVDKFKAKAATSVKASKLDAYEDDVEDGVYADIDMDDVNEALVMIVDGDVVAIYVLEK